MKALVYNLYPNKTTVLLYIIKINSSEILEINQSHFCHCSKVDAGAGKFCKATKKFVDPLACGPQKIVTLLPQAMLRHNALPPSLTNNFPFHPPPKFRLTPSPVLYYTSASC